MNEVDKIILDSYQYLSSLNIGRFIYSGSYGLYINGIDLGRDLYDIDIRFPDLTLEEKHNLKLEFSPHIDKLPERLKFGEEIWEEKDFHGVKLLVFTPESIVRAKQVTLNFLSDPKTFMTERRKSQKEKTTRDLNYLKEHYGL